MTNEKSLLEKLAEDIDETPKQTIVFQAGHFPLDYVPTSPRATEALSQWGVFSLYSLELAVVNAAYARGKGREVRFVLFADDHTNGSRSGLNSRQRAKLRNNLYKLRSGEDARLHSEYQRILGTYGFSEKDVLRQDQKKEGRRNSLYFSELLLRAKGNQNISSDCAREYIQFIGDQNYFNRDSSHLISFVPRICRDNICNNALDEELDGLIEGLSASHVFMETYAIGSSREELYKIGQGVTYRKD